jgi:hypothetical protein
MAEEKQYTESEAHRYFAAHLHGQVWDLLERTDRTPSEDERMLHTAHASCYHWLQVGTGLNHQRGEWLISRVHAVLGNADRALSYAQRCLQLTEQYAELMQDFDFAFAYECVARAYAIAGDRDQAQPYISMAEEAGHKIQDEADRRIFFEDFNGGDWGGLK